LVSVLQHIEPIAVAMNVFQGSSMHADHVMLIFAKLYQHYTALLESNPIIHAPVKAVLSSLMKWWVMVDHKVFIRALVLNPFIKWCLFSTSLSIITLAGMAKWMYSHVFKEEAPPALLTHFHECFGNSGDIFGNSDWEVNILQELVPVCSDYTQGSFNY
jgi:hypothetical protein